MGFRMDSNIHPTNRTPEILEKLAVPGITTFSGLVEKTKLAVPELVQGRVLPRTEEASIL
jgi:hypothetical protein